MMLLRHLRGAGLAACLGLASTTFAALAPDGDGDGLPDLLESRYGRDAAVRDNDVFGSAELFALQQYRDFLRREGDAGGVAFWTGRVRSGAVTRADAVANFLTAPEFEGRIAPVARLYFAYFRRVPDIGGLLYWADQSAGGATLDAISQAFVVSPEFQATYGALDNAGFVTQLYRNVLGREPDAGGLAYWTGQLDAGNLTRGGLMVAYSESPEFRTRIGPEVQTTAIYAGMLQRSPDEGGFAYWAGQIRGGASPQQLIAAFLASDEYKGRFLGSDFAARLRSFDAAAARVLNTTTFGQMPALVAKVRDIGAAAWVDEQLATPVAPFPDYPYYPATRPASCTFTTSASTPESICERDNYTLYQLQNAFFQSALAAPDQLRKRVAFALGQILVVSGTDVSLVYAMRNYQQKLVDGAFGNFYDLLYTVTLDPVMGRYLDMVNNAKPNASGTVLPNENYARELLQLFSVGVWKLNPDGSLVIDGSGNAVPTYDQEEVEDLAHVFTGWTYPPQPGATSRWTNPVSYHAPMVPIESQHDTGSRTLLDGEVLPAGLTADAGLRAALLNIFRHPNVGPFIGRQLIQHLVTSNPSPAYVQRVVAVFNDNGQGVRGDLKAVVRAIVLDPEALGPHPAEYGKLKEPVLFVTSLLRALGGTSDGLYLRQQASGMGQNVFNAPSVFNYYPADYVIPATDLDGPSFALYNATTIFSRANFAYQMTYGGGANPDPLLAGAIGTRIDLSPWQPLAGDPRALVEAIAERMLPGQWTAALRDAVVPAVSAVPATNTLERVRAAVYLIADSPKFQVER